MASQQHITAYFGKRRATSVLNREAKIHKGDATIQANKIDSVNPGKEVAQEIETIKYFQAPLRRLLQKVPQTSESITSSNTFPKEETTVRSAPSEKPVEPQVPVTAAEVKPKVEDNAVPVKALEILGQTADEIMGKQTAPTTPHKGASNLPTKSPVCDIKSFMTAKSPYRPECRSETPVKYFRIEGKSKNEITPAKTPGSIMKSQGRPPSAVKKSIKFDEEALSAPVREPSPPADTDDIIKAANALVEKLQNKGRKLADIANPKPTKKPQVMNAELLKKKLARSAKLAELKSSLSRLGQQCSDLVKMEKKVKEKDEPKIRKFDSIEIEVPKSPHKGALQSPMKSPAKPAYERFAHLVHRTAGPSATTSLPLPMCYQKLLDLFTAADTVCSMMLNRGEIITFKKLKPAVEELTRNSLREHHLGQMAAVLPSAFKFRQEKLRNFGSTSKVDRYELVIVPDFEAHDKGAGPEVTETTNLITAADRKKMTPKVLQRRKELFFKNLLDRTMDKHEEFLASLDPPLNIVRNQLTRWHPNFPVDLVPEVPPASLPEPPTVANAPTSAKDVLERAKKVLDANIRMKNALETASQICEPSKPEPVFPLSEETKAKVDKRVAAHDPLKGISKSLLDRIRAKQAAKALEVMKMTPADEAEILLLSKLPETARVVRGLFVDQQKGVLPLETVIEKIMFSAKRTSSKGDVETAIRRLITELPDWLSVFSTDSSRAEYLKLNRTAPFAPITEKLEKLLSTKRGY